MNSLVLVGRVIFFDCSKKTLKLSVKNERKTDEFIINFPNQPENIMRYLREKFTKDTLVNIKANLTMTNNKLMIVAKQIRFYK